MQREYDAVYLSAHLDDVALSCGGQVHDLITAGKSVLVVTLTAGDPPEVLPSEFARSMCAAWGCGGAVMVERREEDRQACGILGADILHLPFQDALFRCDRRTGRPLYPDRSSLFSEPRPVDLELVEQAARQLAPFSGVRQLCAPLAVGGHVDHRLARMVGEHLAGRSFRCYEDYPYVEKPGALQAAVESTGPWWPQIVPVSRGGLDARIRASRCYRSQIGEDTEIPRRIFLYAVRIGGERLWRRGVPATGGDLGAE